MKKNCNQEIMKLCGSGTDLTNFTLSIICCDMYALHYLGIYDMDVFTVSSIYTVYTWTIIWTTVVTFAHRIQVAELIARMHDE